MYDKEQWFAAMDEETRLLIQDNDAMNALSPEQLTGVILKAINYLDVESKEALRQGLDSLAKNPDVMLGIQKIAEIAGEYGKQGDHSNEKTWDAINKCWRVIEDMRPMRALRAVRRNLAILWGDEFSDNPLSFQDSLRRCGLTKEQALAMSPGDFLKLAGERKSSENSEDIYIALDLIFKERYGWPEGTAKKLPYEALRLSLEHALEYDAPDKRSVWQM